jgi:hypothetical protein
MVRESVVRQVVRVGGALVLGVLLVVACDSNGPDEACPPGGTSSIAPYPGPAQPNVPTGACTGSEVCDYLVDSPHCSIDAWKCTCQHRTWNCYIQYLGGSICPPDAGLPEGSSTVDASSKAGIPDAADGGPDATATEGEP